MKMQEYDQQKKEQLKNIDYFIILVMLIFGMAIIGGILALVYWCFYFIPLGWSVGVFLSISLFLLGIAHSEAEEKSLPRVAQECDTSDASKELPLTSTHILLLNQVPVIKTDEVSLILPETFRRERSL